MRTRAPLRGAASPPSSTTSRRLPSSKRSVTRSPVDEPDERLPVGEAAAALPARAAVLGIDPRRVAESVGHGERSEEHDQEPRDRREPPQPAHDSIVGTALASGQGVFRPARVDEDPVAARARTWASARPAASHQRAHRLDRLRVRRSAARARRRCRARPRRAVPPGDSGKQARVVPARDRRRRGSGRRAARARAGCRPGSQRGTYHSTARRSHARRRPRRQRPPEPLRRPAVDVLRLPVDVRREQPAGPHLRGDGEERRTRVGGVLEDAVTEHAVERPGCERQVAEIRLREPDVGRAAHGLRRRVHRAGRVDRPHLRTGGRQHLGEATRAAADLEHVLAAELLEPPAAPLRRAGRARGFPGGPSRAARAGSAPTARRSSPCSPRPARSGESRRVPKAARARTPVLSCASRRRV